MYKEIFMPEEPEVQEEASPEDFMAGIREMQKAGLLE